MLDDFPTMATPKTVGLCALRYADPATGAVWLRIMMAGDEMLKRPSAMISQAITRR